MRMRDKIETQERNRISIYILFFFSVVAYFSKKGLLSYWKSLRNLFNVVSLLKDVSHEEIRFSDRAIDK